MLRRNHCILWLLLPLLCCQKEQSGKQQRLNAFSDTRYKYSVQYNGNQITALLVDSGAAAPFTIVEYSYAPNYIRANLHPSTGLDYVEYFLMNRVFPAAIVKHKIVDERDSIVSRTDFFYPPGSTLPDSVVFRNSNKFTFIPLYHHGNITDYLMSHNDKPAILAGSFLYYPQINIFKTTNPLLFVYNNPVFEFETFLLPRLFSAQTMKKFNGGSFLFDTDANGNLSLEDYGPNIYPYKRTYQYR